MSRSRVSRWWWRTPGAIRSSGATPPCGSWGGSPTPGVPLVTSQGYVVGAFSVVDGMARLWSERDVALLHDLAACAASEIELRVLRAQDARRSCRTRTAGPRPPDVFEDTGIPMGIASSEGRWTRVNQPLCELLGVREEELLGALAEGIVHPDDRPGPARGDAAPPRRRVPQLHLRAPVPPPRAASRPGGW